MTPLIAVIAYAVKHVTLASRVGTVCVALGVLLTPAVVAWIADRFAAKPAPATCG